MDTFSGRISDPGFSKRLETIIPRFENGIGSPSSKEKVGTKSLCETTWSFSS